MLVFVEAEPSIYPIRLCSDVWQVRQDAFKNPLTAQLIHEQYDTCGTSAFVLLKRIARLCLKANLLGDLDQMFACRWRQDARHHDTFRYNPKWMRLNIIVGRQHLQQRLIDLPYLLMIADVILIGHFVELQYRCLNIILNLIWLCRANWRQTRFADLLIRNNFIPIQLRLTALHDKTEQLSSHFGSPNFSLMITDWRDPSLYAAEFWSSLQINHCTQRHNGFAPPFALQLWID